MYRGIIQHKTYITPYLKNEIKARSLTEPLSFGRIYKVIPQNKKLRKAKFPNDRVKLVKLLGDKNGWIRNMAQQALVDAGDRNILSGLRKLLNNSKEPLGITHALWTMEGLGILSAEDVLPFLKQAEWPLQMQALSVSRSVISKENYKDFLGIFNELINNDNSHAAPYIAFLSGTIKEFNPDASGKLLKQLSRKFSTDVYVSDAVISNLKNEELSFYSQLRDTNPDTTLIINKRLKKVIEDIDKEKKNNPNLAREFPRGASIFKSNCQTCHGSDGNGIASLAPPLNNSNWVVGNKNHVSGIVLYGLSGPIKIGNKLYEAPEINGEMPGIALNSDFSDADIADLLNYIRNSWSNKGEKVRTEEVTTIRNKFKGRQKPFTMKELNSME
jgi:mono/diheme cytochrome c family protein